MRVIDELSNLSEESMRSIPYDEYFDEMDLTEEEKEKHFLWLYMGIFK